MGPEDTGALLRDGLIWDPRLLLDGRLLELLHGELHARMGAEDARAALLCAGFVQGYRDGCRALDSRGDPIAPLLRLTARGVGPRVYRGGWPDLEAVAATAGGASARSPTCALSAGYASGWLTALCGEDVLAREVACTACGAPTCRFEARPAGAWTGRDPALRAALEALPFAALRAEVERRDDRRGPVFDRDAAAVHVWGPVMVVPYSGDDTACAVDAVVREGADEPIAVVVVDVGRARLDAGFAAAALEQTVEVIHSRGAEAVIAGVSRGSRALLGGLSCGPDSLHDDLPQAIAAAFRIADSRRRSA